MRISCFGDGKYKQDGRIDGYAAALQGLDSYRARIKGEYAANMNFLWWAEQNTWNPRPVKLACTLGTRLDDPWAFERPAP